MAETQSTPKFPLLKLPYLPLKEAVKEMDILDINKLSKSSKIGDDLVKFMNLKTEGIRVYAGPQDSFIKFQKGGNSNVTTPDQYFYNKKEDIPPDDSDDDSKVNHVVPNSLDGCLRMTEELQRLFKMNYCSYHFSYLGKGPEEMVQILSRILKNPCSSILIIDRLIVKGQQPIERVIDKRVLDYIMDNCNLDAHLNFHGLFPEDYNHENLFKFQSFYHFNASWVTIDMLKSLRNAGSFCFSHMNFTSKQINEFIKYFVNCGEYMMDSISIHIKEENEFVEDEVLNQLVTLECVDEEHGYSYYLIKVRHTKNQKHILAKLTLLPSFLKGIELKTVEDNEQYTVQLEILELMEKDNDLEEELVEIEKEEKQVEVSSSNAEENLEKLMSRREKILIELEEIRTDLTHLRQ